MDKDKKISIKQIRSVIGEIELHKRTIRALGIRKLNQEVILPDTPAIRGMVKQVSHLVKVTEIDRK